MWINAWMKYLKQFLQTDNRIAGLFSFYPIDNLFGEWFGFWG
jgi:hypothetical protein